MNLEVVRHRGPAAMPQVIKAQALARELLTDVRNIVKLVRHDERDDLRLLLEEAIENVPKIDIHLNVASDVAGAQPGQVEVVLRVVQEALTNCMRHSGCANLWIDVTRDGDAVRVSARDDGGGAPRLAWGNGLTGMRERVEAAGRALDVVPDTPPVIEFPDFIGALERLKGHQVREHCVSSVVRLGRASVSATSRPRSCTILRFAGIGAGSDPGAA
jgi:signal transduction histidine kinase